MRFGPWVAAAGVLAAVGCLAVPKWPTSSPDASPAASAEPAADALEQADRALATAARCLERGDEAGAVPHFRTYLRANPDAHLTRAHLAELLLKAGDKPAARDEFERFLRDAPPAGPAHARRAQCHTRLMQIAEDAGDAFEENLHRGAGLVLLVEKWAADADRRDDVLIEQTLAKAVAALNAARADRPTDARANLHLAAALDRLDQPAAATRARRHARAGLPDARLSDAERAGLLAAE